MRRWIRRHPDLAAALWGGALFCLVIGAIELMLAGFVNRREGRMKFEPGTVNDFLVLDSRLGYRLAPDRRTTCTRVIDGAAVYRATYSVDARGLRVTPSGSSMAPEVRQDDPSDTQSPDASPRAPVRRFMLFFVCSFTFGQGVNDEEAMPSQVAKLAPAIVPYNYAVPGYGPQQMLDIVRSDALSNVVEGDGWLVYSFIDDHLRRAIGSMYVYGVWGADMPFYEIDDQGILVRRGTFMHDRVWTSRLYGLLWKSAIVRYFGVDLPVGNSPQHTRLTREIILASRDAFLKRFGLPSDRFVVLIYPGSRHGRELSDELRPRGVRVLDYRELFELEPPRFRYARDEHPTPEAHRRIASELVKDLALGPGR